LWFPGIALASAAVAETSPAGLTPAGEAALIATGSLLLATLTDRLAAWPRGPAPPAVAVLCAYPLDLGAGSPLTATAITGPNPAGGARFFGIGNELEVMLAVTALVGVGAASSRTGRAENARAVAPRRARSPAEAGVTTPRERRSGWVVPLVFAAAGLLCAVLLGAGRLGADVGAAFTLGAGTAVAAVIAAPGRAGRRRAAVAVLAGVAIVGALGLVAAIDSLTGGGAHLSRSVLEPGSEGWGEVLKRRARTQFGLLGSLPAGVVAAMALTVLAALALNRRRLLAPLSDVGMRPLRAGLGGAFAAVVVGAVANDSAPDMLAIGATLLVLAVGYVRSRPAGAGDASHAPLAWGMRTEGRPASRAASGRERP
jgi:hypothetical protein